MLARELLSISIDAKVLSRVPPAQAPEFPASASFTTSNLIGSDKVEGTPVYRLNGDNIGQIERVMIGKISGKVANAVMSFGGFLGIDEDYYPLPWSVLTYKKGLQKNGFFSPTPPSEVRFEVSNACLNF